MGLASVAGSGGERIEKILGSPVAVSSVGEECQRLADIPQCRERTGSLGPCRPDLDLLDFHPEHPSIGRIGRGEGLDAVNLEMAKRSGAGRRGDRRLENVVERGEHPVIHLARHAVDHDPQAVDLCRAEMIADPQPEVERSAPVDSQIEGRHRAGADPTGALPAVDLAGMPADTEEPLPHVDEHRGRRFEDPCQGGIAGLRIEDPAVRSGTSGDEPACSGDEASVDHGTGLGEPLLLGRQRHRLAMDVVHLQRVSRWKATEPGDEFREGVVELLDEADDVDRRQSRLEKADQGFGGIALPETGGAELGEQRLTEGKMVSDRVAEERGPGKGEEGRESAASHRAEASVTVTSRSDNRVVPPGDHPPFGMEPGDGIAEEDGVDRVAEDRLPVGDPERVVEKLGTEDRSEGIASRRLSPLPRQERFDVRRSLAGGRPFEELHEGRAGTLVDMVEDDARQHNV